MTLLEGPTQERPGLGAPLDGLWAQTAPARWVQRYRSLVRVLDAVSVAAAAVLPFRLPTPAGPVRGLPYDAVIAVLAVCWLFAITLGRGYEARFLGSGSEEFRRLGRATGRVAAVVALLGCCLRLEPARAFVTVAVPAGLVLVVLSRLVARRWLQRVRRDGRCRHRVIVVGDVGSATRLVRALARDPAAPLQVVGACVPGQSGRLEVGDLDVPVVPDLAQLPAALHALHADTLVVDASARTGPDALQRLSYQLEGSGVDLLVAPTLTELAGSRVSLRSVAGLPLLHVDEPELLGSRRAVKEVFDRSAALVLLVLLAPALLVIGLLVRCTSAGPALFLQQRVGRGGAMFRVWKFRSMHVDAESRLAQLAPSNENDGILFKIRADPRVTSVGRVLRRYSLDELPQLVNVVLGSMALVGPRPPLPSEVERYESHTHRRLLVKPGLTGLWQVSGRSDLSWDDSVRLDLLYVETWSLGLDLAVLGRTLGTVVRGDGAY